MPYANPEDRRNYYRNKLNNLTTEERAKYLADKAEYRERNREQIRERGRKHYVENKARLNLESSERTRRWNKEHPQEYRVKIKRRHEAIKARRLVDPDFNEKYLEKKAAAKLRYKAKHPEKVRQQDWRSRGTGWTLELFETTKQAQRNLCAICQETLVKPCADHKHVTPPLPRGILCPTCNAGLGMFKDRPELLQSAADYLRMF